MASELLLQLFNKKLEDCEWPAYDPALAQQQEVTGAVQVNGKTRGTLVLPVDMGQADVERLAQKEVAKWLGNQQIAKVIYVHHRLVNFVVQ